MNYMPIYNYLIPVALFAGLFISHLVCIWIGWKMGCKADHAIVTNENIKPVKEHHSPDPYAEEII